MYAKVILPALAGLAIANAQTTTLVTMAPPPPVNLTTSFSAVLPVIPTETPFSGVDTNEGALIYDGPPNPGFTGLGGNATVQSNLPLATYVATLPDVMYDPYTGTVISGTITGMTAPGGNGVMFMVNFTGFPSVEEYGPFAYHVHALPVPINGNCTATLAHLDPTNRGELYACDVANPQSCQAGDLVGKHGNVTSSTFTASYTDLFLSTVPGSPYFFGDKSIVLHTRNSTRLTCANFVLVSGGTNTTTGGNATTTVAPVPSFEAAASRTFAFSAFGAVVAVVAALML